MSQEQPQQPSSPAAAAQLPSSPSAQQQRSAMSRSQPSLRLSNESTFKRSPVWTMSSTQPVDFKSDSGPDPGHYHTEKDPGRHKFRTTTTFTWGKAHREGFQPKYNEPTVGSYNVPLGPYNEKRGEQKKDHPTKPRFATSKFGTSKRLPNTRNQEVPGPGTYEWRDLTCTQKKSIASRQKLPSVEEAMKDNPAPGNYDPKEATSHYESKAQNLGGTGERFRFIEKATPKDVGPGSYKYEAFKMRYKNDPTYSFKASRREMRGSASSPGPSDAWSSFG